MADLLFRCGILIQTGDPQLHEEKQQPSCA